MIAQGRGQGEVGLLELVVGGAMLAGAVEEALRDNKGEGNAMSLASLQDMGFRERLAGHGLGEAEELLESLTAAIDGSGGDALDVGLCAALTGG